MHSGPRVGVPPSPQRGSPGNPRHTKETGRARGRGGPAPRRGESRSPPASLCVPRPGEGASPPGDLEVGSMLGGTQGTRAPPPREGGPSLGPPPAPPPPSTHPEAPAAEPAPPSTRPSARGGRRRPRRERRGGREGRRAEGRGAPPSRPGPPPGAVTANPRGSPGREGLCGCRAGAQFTTGKTEARRAEPPGGRSARAACSTLSPRCPASREEVVLRDGRRQEIRVPTHPAQPCPAQPRAPGDREETRPPGAQGRW